MFRQVSAFYADMRAVLQPTWTVVESGGHAVYAIANNVIRGARVRSHRILAAIAGEAVSPREIARLRRRSPSGRSGLTGP